MLLIALLVFLMTSWAHACPEIIIPIDPRDGALKSHAFKRAFKHFRAKRYKAAFKAFTKTAKKLQEEAETLFQPQGKATTANAKIQTWLGRHVYNKNAGVLIRSDRFTYPTLVWWAWADASCRLGKLDVARRALRQVRSMQPSPELMYHEAIIGLRLGQLESARKMLLKTPPESFITPYVQGMIAKHEGRTDDARKRLKQAKDAAILKDRIKAATRALKELSRGK